MGSESESACKIPQALRLRSRFGLNLAHKIWDYHGKSGEWFWTGEGEPEGDYYFQYEELTEKEKKRLKNQKREWMRSSKNRRNKKTGKRES